MNRFSFKRYTGLTLVLILIGTSGCATVKPEAGFREVEREVAERASYRIQWTQDAPKETEVSNAVEILLRDTLTVEEAVQIALLNNRRLQATYQDLGVAQAAVVQSGLLRNPIFGGDVAFPFEGGPTDLGLEVALDFLDIFYIPLRRAVARSSYESAKMRVTGAALDLAAQVRAAYYRAQAGLQQTEMLEQVMLAAEATYEASIRLHAAGNIPNLDLHTEQALYEQARLAVVAAEAAAIESRETLTSLMGLWGENLQFTIANRLPSLPEQPENADDLEARAITASLDLGIARQEIETYGQRLGVERTTALIPELEIGGVAEREDGEWKAGPSLAIPVPLFDLGQARRAAARAELRRRQEIYFATAVEVRSTARTLQERLLASRRIAEHYRDVLLPLRMRITQETQLQYNAMQIGIYQLLQAKEQEIEVGRQYIDALEAYWLARTDIDLLLQGRMPPGRSGIDPGAMTAEPSQQVRREDH